MNILMIDDEPGRWLLVRRELELAGIDVRRIGLYSAHGFEQVKYYLEDSNVEFDLVLLDHDMPLMNGYDVAHQFLIQRDIDVVVISNNEPASRRILALLEEYEVWCARACIANHELITELVFARLQDMAPAVKNSAHDSHSDGMT